MANNKPRFVPPILLITGILAVFLFYILLADRFTLPRLFEIFEICIVLGSLIVLIKNYPYLQKLDWVMGIGLGAFIAVTANFATLFSPYPFLDLVKSQMGVALIRGGFTSLAALAGLIIMRRGGPVLFRLARCEWCKSGKSWVFGLTVGLPLAVLNVFALQFSESQPISWQNPWAALLDAFHPAIFEEVVYRFALLGMIWWVLHASLPKHAAWLSGLLALVVHNFSHFSDLFIEAPLLALGIGTVMAILWGLPLTLLALRKDLDSAIAFHWIQDFARFLTGF